METKEAKLLEGKFLAQKIQEEIAQFIRQSIALKFPPPKLTAMLVSDGSASGWYVSQQEKLAAKLGIEFQKISPTQPPDQKTLIQMIQKANQSEATGIFIAMPLPADYDADEVVMTLDPKKDVEGIHPASLGLIVLRKAKLIPPTAYAAYTLIKSTGIALRGKRAVIAGQSPIVGRPLNLLLGEERVTTTICNTGTSEDDLRRFISESDIVIACAGKPGLIQGKWIKKGAIVIDVGTTEVNGKLVGDVEFEEAKKHAAFITPVPGGVGPLTVTMLMQNLIHAYQWQHRLS